MIIKKREKLPRLFFWEFKWIRLTPERGTCCYPGCSGQYDHFLKWKSCQLKDNYNKKQRTCLARTHTYTLTMPLHKHKKILNHQEFNTIDKVDIYPYGIVNCFLKHYNSPWFLSVIQAFPPFLFYSLSAPCITLAITTMDLNKPEWQQKKWIKGGKLCVWNPYHYNC